MNFRETISRSSKGSALKALEGEGEAEKCIDELMDAVDSYIPTPVRDVEKPFFDAGGRYLHDSGSGNGGHGANRAGQGEGERGRGGSGIRDTLKTVVTGVEMFKKLLDEGRRATRGLLLREGSGRTSGVDRSSPSPSITPHTKFKQKAIS